ncbi:MAG: MarR family transcriptional regulator [Epsilonproteobacteria bacterium]|nr:MarR family transcriptional regulator [Campylobacterota bacterium]
MKHFDKETALGYQIHITANLMRNNFNDFLKPYDIYTEQYGVLCVLNDQDNLTLSQIAELIYKDKPTVTRLIDSLEKRGFINKSPSPTDRRASLVTMTQKGQNLYDEIGACLKIAKMNIEQRIDQHEREVALKVLAQLREMNISEEVKRLQKDKEC